MECSIYALGEVKKKRLREARSLLVLARSGSGDGEGGEKLILVRDELNALWMLPGGVCQKGEDEAEAARRILGDALGEAVFDVRALCGFGVTEEDGKERTGTAYLADVREWPDERASHAKAFARMPLGSQTAEAALCFGLHRFAGEFFDARLTIERLGQPAAL
ncbi:MAG: hypothetical protein ACI4MU_08120 [Candidatus Ventricola sp.]